MRFAFGCEQRKHPLSSRSGWCALNKCLEWSTGGSRGGSGCRMRMWPDWAQGDGRVSLGSGLQQALIGPAVCYCTVELPCSLLSELVTWAQMPWLCTDRLCIPPVQWITVACSQMNAFINGGDIEINLITSWWSYDPIYNVKQHRRCDWRLMCTASILTAFIGSHSKVCGGCVLFMNVQYFQSAHFVLIIMYFYGFVSNWRVFKITASLNVTYYILKGCPTFRVAQPGLLFTNVPLKGLFRFFLNLWFL